MPSAMVDMIQPNLAFDLMAGRTPMRSTKPPLQQPEHDHDGQHRQY
jgi:hypothetical protein